MAKVVRPESDATRCRFCLVASRFNEPYVERLVEGALEVLVNRGAADQDLEVHWVPGSFELPLACRWAADSGRFDAILAFGVLLRGETEHFRLVADASSQGLVRVALDTGTPVLNGILAAYDAEQVAARTGGCTGIGALRSRWPRCTWRGSNAASMRGDRTGETHERAGGTVTRLERARRRAREVAFRVVYQADLAHDSYAETWRARRKEETLTQDQVELVDDIAGLLERRGAEVDEALRSAARNWTLERLGATDRAVLKAAVSELLGRPGTPARVVLDEAIEIAKRYGTEESGRFVNGVLDRVARTLRPEEF